MTGLIAGDQVLLWFAVAVMVATIAALAAMYCPEVAVAGNGELVETTTS